ncbi:MAG: Asp-tRNA(Asn)/Glu-tRNA(Gln) amidotransferase subunit GatC [Ignavibacteria bacterium]|jgi:aspartyl-tRNA(Asn)/glutamyl-tRNA(Gln) amidotransferase subunit C|nr:Asp-tRNA(Asn)/Glu-tRNA(Gln) amidotransferase subunit GatC [Ignavibacteria bacterium]MDP3829999.1 Asp-tRNA(Asn)/Glu-tRNA(Gln) amidotransferase subunit GatC [Ignavibacteriaceae bacterium]
MSVSQSDVKYIAGLAKLKFEDSEIDSLTEQLNSILFYIDKLNQLDTSDVEPLSYPVEIELNMRDDILKASVSRKEALSNAPDSNDEYFKVPKVIG